MSIASKLGLNRTELRAWALYDFANSAVQTTIIAAVFPIYFQRVAASGLLHGVALRFYRLALAALLGLRFGGRVRTPVALVLAIATLLALLVSAKLANIAVPMVMKRIVESPLGKILQAIRENEVRAEAVGYHVPRFKLLAFVIGGAFSGLAGVLYAMLFGIVGFAAFELIVVDQNGDEEGCLRLSRLPTPDEIAQINASLKKFEDGQVRPKAEAIHVCYCHSPFRYAWHERELALDAAARRTARH